jgi:hypothetical protein
VIEAVGELSKETQVSGEDVWSLRHRREEKEKEKKGRRKKEAGSR